MLDWFTGLVGYDASMLKLGEIRCLDKDGELLWSKERREEVEGSFSSKILIGRESSTLDMCKASRSLNLLVSPAVLTVSGNPVKFLQGHNAFGPSVSSLSSIIQAFVRALPARIRPPDADSELWPAVHRSRIDTTVRVEMGKHEYVHEWLEAAATTTRSRHGRALVSGDTVYWGQHSTRWTMKAYCKFCELLAHPCPDHSLNETLREYVRSQLRIELTLRRPELKDRGTLTEDLVWEFFGRISCAGLKTAGGLTMEKVKEGRLNLNSGAEMCLTLWLAGKPVKAMLSRKTFYRYRLAVMKETGLDISLPAADQGKAIESIKMDLEYLKAHELKDVPAHLQLWLFKPGACPSWT
jgi:hypothetical protein